MFVSSAAAQAPDSLSLEPVATGLTQPVYVAAPPGDGRRLMVVEQGGAVRVIRDGQVLPDPFLTLSQDFRSGGERGLLSIAFAPDYESTRLFYLYYTDADGDIRVDQFRRALDSRDQAEPGYRRTVIEIPHREAGNHNGGQVAFGPDGLLYLGSGDGGNSYDQPNRDARDVRSLLGKVLRIAPTAGGGYTVPTDNPYPGSPVWALGLRNPFRFSFDGPTGDLWIGDVGQSKIEEIDRAPATAGLNAGSGLNFGWDDCEGSLAAEPQTGSAPCTLEGDTLPVLEKARPASGFCSVTGGRVVRDPGLEALDGRYLYGDYCISTMRSFAPANPGGDRAETSLDVGSLTAVGEDACGRVYAVEIGGRVSRIQDSTPSGCAVRVPEPAGAIDPPAGGGSPTAISVRGAQRQRALRRGGVLLRVRCDQACGFRVLARLSLKRGGRPRRLKGAVKHLAAGTSVRVRLELTKSGRRALRTALSKRKRVTAKATVRSRASGGAVTTTRRTIRLVR